MEIPNTPENNSGSGLWPCEDLQLKQMTAAGLLEVNGVQGFLLPDEVVFLHNLLLTLPLGGSYLEVGSWMGLSAIICANSLTLSNNISARIHCVDTWEGSEEHQDLDIIKKRRLYDIFSENVRRANFQNIIRAHRGQSTEVAESFDNNSLDIIFIDGDHSYEGCLADMEAWFPKLKPDGRFLGHDGNPFNCGVFQAVQAFCGKHGFHFSMYPPPKWHFIWEVKGF